MRQASKIMKRVATAALAGAFAFSVAVAPAAVQPRHANAANLKSQATSAAQAAKATSGSVKSRLKKAANYAVKKYKYKRNSTIIKQENNARSNKSGWWKPAAKTMFSSKKGSCYNDAAAFAAMAKAATGAQVRVASGKAKSYYWSNSGSTTATQNHSWVEVKVGGTWYIYDTNLSRYGAAGKSGYIGKKRSSKKAVYNNFKGVKYQTVNL